MACSGRYYHGPLGCDLTMPLVQRLSLAARQGTLQLRSYQGVKLEDTETLCNNLSVGNVGTLLLPATWWSCWRQPIQSRFLFDIDSQNAIISRRKRISRSFTNKSGGPPFNVRSTPIVLRKVSVTVHKIFPIRKAPSRFCSLSANGRRDCCWRNRSSKFRAPPGLISWENISSSAFQQRV
jgi:hypothetical protein